ncbi:MAG: class I adenylate-forming enzyme family protein [Sporichthyaceae bacterium]
MTLAASPQTAPAFAWGTEIARRRDGALPFLMYSPRRRHLVELLADVARWPGRTLVVQGERRMTTEHFLGAVADLAARLTADGVGPGDRVLLLAPNSPEWMVAFWATLATGAVAVPGNGWWSAEEVAHAVELVDPAVVVADGSRMARVGSGPRRLSIDDVRSVVDGAAPRCEAPIAPAGHEDDPAVVVFTAGTTGMPKGAVLAHRSVVANLHNLLATSKRLPHTLSADVPGQVSLHTFPLFHIGGIQVMCFSMLTGGTMVFLEGRFDSRQVLDLIESERVNLWGAIPTMAVRVLDDPSLPDRDCSSLQSLSLGGAPVGAELVGRLRAAFPNLVRGVSANYGMTEAGGSVASAAATVMAEHPGTSGRPLPAVELRVDRPDDDGVGEILVRSPAQMLGYWGEEDSPVDHEGFLHTGDLGTLRDGLLWVVGRSKDVVIRGGENIAAAHVESVLAAHPAVAEVGVIPVPHPTWGEEIAAVVVVRTGHGTDAADLAAHGATRLAHFEVPAHWWLRAEPLPVNAAGKVDKRLVAEQWRTREIPTEEHI